MNRQFKPQVLLKPVANHWTECLIMPPVRSFPESMYGKIDLDCTLYPKVFLRFFLYRAGDVFVFDCRIKRILGKHPGDLGDSVSKACLL